MRSNEQASDQAAKKPARDFRGRLLPGASGNPAGRRAPLDRAARAAVARATLIAELAADLGRPPSATESLLIEATASQVFEARERRRLGRSSADPDRLMTRMLRALLGIGVKPGAARPKASASTLRGYLTTRADGGA